MVRRTLLPEIEARLSRWGKMVFISGPRQVGKTTLAKELRRHIGGGLYFNWDLITDRKRLARDPYFFQAEVWDPGRPRLLIFDEIHKYARWKSYLKGVYDAFHEDHFILVTGSGRLDLYRRGGESLLGRYVQVPIFPLTVGELLGKRPTWKEFVSAAGTPPSLLPRARGIFERLFRFGGFPEPYLKGDSEFHRVWSATRKQLLIREDIRDATNIRNLSLLEMLVHIVEPKVGSPLSINSLREDLGVAFETVRDWIDVLSNFYYFFRIAPYSKALIRSLRKETKLYYYDWSEVESEGPRFENLIALHLLKAAKTWTALGEASVDLFYLRDKEKREVDFLLVADRKPLVLVECKRSDAQPSPHLLWYQERLKAPIALQLLLEKGHNREYRNKAGIQRVISAERWLSLLP